MATTTGFVTENFETWPAFAPIWLLFLTCIVCSTGSTGGGIKMFRTLLLARQAGRELKLLVHPSAMWPVRIGGKPVPDHIGDSVLAFIFLYFMTVVTLTFAMLLTGLELRLVLQRDRGLHQQRRTRPRRRRTRRTTSASLTNMQTWICTAAMLVGTPGDLQRARALHAGLLAQVDSSDKQRTDHGSLIAQSLH